MLLSTGNRYRASKSDIFDIISVTGGYYPSPGIDFEVLGVKLDRAGVNSRRGEVGCVTV